jgi:diacylglycerol kinase (ATP)
MKAHSGVSLKPFLAYFCQSIRFDSVHVIINPASGKDRPVLSVLNDVFRAGRVDWEVSVTKGAGDARRLAADAARSGVSAVAVYGGDGTVTEVAAGLAGSNVPLALLPGGTANAIAQALGIPLDLAVATRSAFGPESTIRAVDMGQAGEQHFLIAVGIGIPGAIAEGADREAKDRLGMIAYAWSTLEALRNSPVADYHIVVDGRRIDTRGVMCLIANSGNFGVPMLKLTSSIDMADGLLDVMVAYCADLRSLLSIAESIAFRDSTVAHFEHWQGRVISVEADPPQEIQADGEVLQPRPLTVRVLPSAVQFLVPARSPDTRPERVAGNVAER